MRRLAARIPFAWVVLGLALALASPALADERDPRCQGWERDGAPPGIDMAVHCPGGGPGLVDPGLGSEPLIPYVVALLVVGGVLTVFGFIAMRVTRSPARPRIRDASAWWTCGGCGTTNQPDRAACFACLTSRGPATPTHPA